MRVLIEGCDGVGKSSVADLLAKKLKLNLIHYNREDPRNFYFYQQSLKKANYVMDRNFISERIYANTYDDEPKLAPYEEKALYDLLEDMKIFTIILTAKEEKLLRRMKPDEDERVIRDRVHIDQAYRKVFRDKIKHGMLIDTSELHPSQVVELIIYHLKGVVQCANTLNLEEK